MECIFKKQIENKSDIQENLLKGTSKKCFYKVIDRNGSVFIFTKKKKNPYVSIYLNSKTKITKKTKSDKIKVCPYFMTTALLSLFDRTVTKTKIFFSIKEEKKLDISI